MTKDELIEALEGIAQEPPTDENDSEVMAAIAVLDALIVTLAGDTSASIEGLAMMNMLATGRVLSSGTMTPQDRAVMVNPVLNGLEELGELDPEELTDDDRLRAITLARKLLQKFATGKFRQQ